MSMMLAHMDTRFQLLGAHVSKAFGGTVALDDVSLAVDRAEILGLIGPNGSGKTTLLNILSGVIAADSGAVRLGDQDVSRNNVHERALAGIARTFQNLRLFGRLTVRQNVEAALAATGLSGDGLPRRADELLALVGLAHSANRAAGSLPYANQRRLELARAMGLGPAFVLLDEPSAGMGESETASLANTILEMVAQLGCGVICVDHDMHLIDRVSNRIAVMQEGKVIATGTPDDVRTNPVVIEAYLGAAWSELEEN